MIDENQRSLKWLAFSDVTEWVKWFVCQIFKLTNSKNLNCPHFESLETAHEYNNIKRVPILWIVILKRCLVWGSLQFEHSIIVPKFWWKSEFILIIALLHIIAHTWVEFKSKIKPLSIWDRVKENNLVKHCFLDHKNQNWQR